MSNINNILHVSAKNGENISDIIINNKTSIIHPFIFTIKTLTNNELKYLIVYHPYLFKYLCNDVNIQRIYSILDHSLSSKQIGHIFKHYVYTDRIVNINDDIMNMLDVNDFYNLYMFYVKHNVCVDGSDKSFYIHKFFIDRKINIYLFIDTFINTCINYLCSNMYNNKIINNIKKYMTLFYGVCLSQKHLCKLEKYGVYLNNISYIHEYILGNVPYDENLCVSDNDEDIINLIYMSVHQMTLTMHLKAKITFANLIFAVNIHHKNIEYANYVLYKCRYFDDEFDVSIYNKYATKYIDILFVLEHVPDYKCVKYVIYNCCIKDNCPELLYLFDNYVPDKNDINETERPILKTKYTFDVNTYNFDHKINMSYMLKQLCDTKQDTLYYYEFCELANKTLKKRKCYVCIVCPKQYKQIKVYPVKIFNHDYISYYSCLSSKYYGDVYFDLCNFLDYCVFMYSLDIDKIEN